MLSAKCYEAERSIPYAAIGESLSGLVNRPELSHVSAGALTEVSRLVPDLSHEASAAPVAFPAAAKQRLHVAVAKCLDAIAACTPVLLQLDDLHWSDHETLEVTHFLVHRLRTSRVLILGSYRPAELPPSVRRFTRSVCGEQLAQLITIEELTAADVEHMLTDFAPVDDAAHARALAHLHRHTGGSPLLLSETLGALDRRGILSAREGRWVLARDARVEELPGTLESLVMERIERLAPWIRACVEVMAVNRSEIGPESLARALGVSEPRLELALAVLTEERLVCRIRRGRYDLAHEEIRRVVVGSIPEERLRTLEASLAARTDGPLASAAARRPPPLANAGAAGPAPDRSEPAAQAPGARPRPPRVVRLRMYGAGLALAAVAALASVVLAPYEGGEPPRADVGGTYFNPKRGLEGTTFLFDPVYHGGARYVVTIRGPQGWNRDSSFDCYPTLAPQVRFARRAICWTLSAPPVSGLYRGISVVGADTLATRFHIDASSSLPPPGIQDVSVRPDGVFLRWAAPAQARAFLVRISALPFGGELRESLVGGAVHQLTLPRPPLEHGRQYQAAIFALGVDITRPGPAPARFNVSVHDWKLRYDSLTDDLVRADPGDPSRR
jgi:DNA-binding transcriptional ArsR family regulator